MDISLSGSAPAPEEDEGGGLEAAYIDAPPPPAASERRTLSGERWVPDTEAVECEACSGKFGFWRRRHHCRRCGNVFCASCSTHRICFRYQTTEVQSSDEDDDEDDARLDAERGTEEVYGSPQRVCDHCFYCSILAPLVEWVYDRQVEGFVRSEELELAIEQLSAVTTGETAEWICRPVPDGDAAAAALEVETTLGITLPPLATLMQWAKVLLELDQGLAGLCAKVKANRLMPEALFWIRYFASVHDELNWADGDDSDELSDDDPDYERDRVLGVDEDGDDYYEDEDEDDDGFEDQGSLGGHPSQQMQQVQLPPPQPQQLPQPQLQQQRRRQVSVASFPLKQAMKDQDTERVLELVHDSRTANSILDVAKRFTLLHVAVLQDNNPVIEHLLKHGAHTDPLSVHGVTPLFAAVAKGKLRAVQLLVGAGANVNLPASNGELPVQHAENRVRTEQASSQPNAAASAPASGDSEGVEPEPEPEPELDSIGGGDGSAGLDHDRGVAGSVSKQAVDSVELRTRRSGTAENGMPPAGVGARRHRADDVNSRGDDGERDGDGQASTPQYIEVARFLRTIYEEKAAEMGNGMTADDLIERMAFVWNQRRQKHIAAMRQQQQQQQQQRQQQQEQELQHAAATPAAGQQLSGPAAVAARKQAVLEAAQAKAQAHRRHQAVLAEIRAAEPAPEPEQILDQESAS